MNDERFIELLNLYIDRELSAEDAREVEEAIAASPERRKIYSQYCKLHCACQQLLAPAVKAPKPSIAALVAAAMTRDDDQVVAFDPTPAATPAAATVRPSSGSGWGWGMATGMMAACAAFAVYLGTARVDPGSIATTSAPAGAPTMAANSPRAATPVGTDDNAALSNDNPAAQAYRTVFVLEPQSSNGTRSNLRLATTNANSDPFAWMNQMTFAPIQPVRLDALEFQTARPMESRTLSAFVYPYPGLDDSPPVSASAAFQFQR